MNSQSAFWIEKLNFGQNLICCCCCFWLCAEFSNTTIDDFSKTVTVAILTYNASDKIESKRMCMGKYVIMFCSKPLTLEPSFCPIVQHLLLSSYIKIQRQRKPFWILLAQIMWTYDSFTWIRYNALVSRIDLGTVVTSVRVGARSAQCAPQTATRVQRHAQAF